MTPRANWKGYLKLSLVSCPVALFPVSSSGEKISFHLLNGETGNRLKQQYVDADTGALVDRDERVKGVETSKGAYIVITDEELAAVQIESSHTIDIERFVPAIEIDPIYIDGHYYLTPDDKVGEEAFAVIREAMRKRGMVGIARVVLFGRERMIMLEPRAKGLMATTLHYAYEVRSDSGYFDDIPKVEIANDLLDLASHIIDTKVGSFDPTMFRDRYQDAIVALIASKKTGKPVEAAKAAKPGNVIDLMDALRKSLGQSGKPDMSETQTGDRGKPGSKTRALPKTKASARNKSETPDKTATPARSKAGSKTKTALEVETMALKSGRRKAS